MDSIVELGSTRCELFVPASRLQRARAKGAIWLPWSNPLFWVLRLWSSALAIANRSDMDLSSDSDRDYVYCTATIVDAGEINLCTCQMVLVEFETFS